MHEHLEQPHKMTLESVEALQKLLRNLKTKWAAQMVTLQARFDTSHNRHGDHILLAKLEKDQEPEEQKTNNGFQAMVELCEIADRNNLPIYLIPVPKVLGIDKFYEHFGFHRCNCWECCCYLVREPKTDPCQKTESSNH